jgi:hypothetical protein
VGGSRGARTKKPQQRPNQAHTPAFITTSLTNQTLQHSTLQTLINHSPTYQLMHNTTLVDVRKEVFSKAKEAEVRKWHRHSKSLDKVLHMVQDRRCTIIDSEK